MAKILLLGPPRDSMLDAIRSLGDEAGCTQEPLNLPQLQAEGWNWLVSYGYKHIIRPDVLACFPGRAINLHISYLPWNRGMHPNVWSFVEDTPKGVTIHEVDQGLDTGPIIVQRLVGWQVGDTLATSYARLSSEIEGLFREWWPRIRAGQTEARPQPREGTLHWNKDLESLAQLLTHGWDTPVEAIIGKRPPKS